jgi:hypothetical protein
MIDPNSRLLALDIAGSEERYAEMMNDAAADLALVDTHAANATGLDSDGQFSSANDLITLGTHLLRDATFRETVSERTAKLNGHTFANTNDLLGSYTGADGIKTGRQALNLRGRADRLHHGVPGYVRRVRIAAERTRPVAAKHRPAVAEEPRPKGWAVQTDGGRIVGKDSHGHDPRRIPG